MPILRDLRETKYLPTFQSLPPVIQEKIRLIEVLYSRAMLHLEAKEGAPAGVPDFKSHLRDIYEKRANGAQTTNKDERQQEGILGAFCLGLEYEDWIEILGDSRYYPWPGKLSYHVMMLLALWLYWMNWPHDRRILESEKEICLSDLVPGAPPSAPSFEANLDRSLVWLAHEVGIEITNIRHWGKKREGVAQQNLKDKPEVIARGEKIIEAFHTVQKNMGDSLNSIVIRIFKELKETISKRTIARHLNENLPLMAHCFKPKQNGKKKRIVYIRHANV